MFRSALTKSSALRASRSAFKPSLYTCSKVYGSRFASDSAIHGKIHQVIGAVVDGK
ncbi:Beta subunit of the F1 sector of mitochondrial F1F0 ATP synthase [Blumeria graminis f. sp. tritici 96224]|uniref:Beta subunit of the F1 sector of mitochondrial F1F0 ATP synthase n=2 Tax=Blumeria graminis f. sp. tritici 96224 TaxID=1268274 RepID=A0A656KNN7_BLUGR|nr:Beta subunit of the F1 sector of mitochondrial F1F0 ATP synthase [Blumeria graminis f. sp. tritici 96224]